MFDFDRCFQDVIIYVGEMVAQTDGSLDSLFIYVTASAESSKFELHIHEIGDDVEFGHNPIAAFHIFETQVEKQRAITIMGRSSEKRRMSTIPISKLEDGSIQFGHPADTEEFDHGFLDKIKLFPA